MDYLEAFKSHIKVKESHDETVKCHPVLAVSALLDKHNITSEVTNKDQKIEGEIKAKEKYLTCLFLSLVDKLMYAQLKAEPKNNYIMGMHGYPQDLP